MHSRQRHLKLKHNDRLLRLALVRHGDIIHPGVAAFSEAVLSEAGKTQMRELAAHWPCDEPTQVYSSTRAPSSPP